jgi:hypothetical protein
MLGVSAAPQPTRNNLIGRTLRRAQQFAVAHTDLRTGTIELPEPLPLLSQRMAARLPTQARQAHANHIEELVARLTQADIERPTDVLVSAESARRLHLHRLDAVARRASHHEPPAASL